MNIKTICMGFALLLASLPAANADVIFNNWNPDAFFGCSETGPTCAASPSFTLSQTTLITNVDTAYSASSEGSVPPSTVSIFDASSTLVGSALSTDNGGFFTGNFQTAAFSLVLTSGTYTVSVSDNHWAFNPESAFQGFAAVDGTVVTPEPATWGMMMGIGLFGLEAARRRRNRKA
ncbi:MAG TPA: PEP-CTERM sorting domain-containing protein [Bryobacteraceae bacterium]